MRRYFAKTLPQRGLGGHPLQIGLPVSPPRGAPSLNGPGLQRRCVAYMPTISSVQSTGLKLANCTSVVIQKSTILKQRGAQSEYR